VSVLPDPVAASWTDAPPIGFPNASFTVTVMVDVPPTRTDVGLALTVDCPAEGAPAVTVTTAVWVTATPAQHFSARGPHDRNRSLWCGYAIELGARKVYFAGDTGYHPDFRLIGQKLGPFDAMLLPVGAYEPRWFCGTCI
jgi:hypothetical protein